MPDLPKDQWKPSLRLQAQEMGLTGTDRPACYEACGCEQITTDSPPSRPKAYLAGPVRGCSNYKLVFTLGKDRLEKLGWEVWSPLDHMNQTGQVPGVDADDRQGLADDVAALVKCKAVMLLPGWYSSRGARAEVAIADALDIPTYQPGEWPNA